ncbi:MAG: endonuclease/exonuclease/phosphatase family metal-dependent hydrolase [Planctomycetota bacterium]|jgi:endonuclease/exonuclease/phosphatase family metal-dependent hydrolase
MVGRQVAGLILKFSLLAGSLFFFATVASANSFSILSQNMNRLFDDVDDGNKEKVIATNRFKRRITMAAKKFTGAFQLPDVIALQEVENLNVLQQLADSIKSSHGVHYRSALIPGLDISGINTGFLINSTFQLNKLEQLFVAQNVPGKDQPLFTRPPLLVELCRYNNCVTVINLHLRSMRGIDSRKSSKRVAEKRLHQAETLARWVDRYQQVNPSSPLMLIGDFNALTPSDEYVDVAGIIGGYPVTDKVKYPGRDLIVKDLFDLTRDIPQKNRYSYIFRQKKQQLDYLFVNQPLREKLISIEFSRINYRFSDHAGLLARFDW